MNEMNPKRYTLIAQVTGSDRVETYRFAGPANPAILTAEPRILRSAMKLKARADVSATTILDTANPGRILR